jgi:hypothetical protein
MTNHQIFISTPTFEDDIYKYSIMGFIEDFYEV